MPPRSSYPLATGAGAGAGTTVMETTRRIPQAPRTERANFSAFWPRRVASDTWTDLLVYVSTAAMSNEVADDARRRIGAATKQTASGDLARGSAVMIVPELDSAEINPLSARVRWR